MRALANVSMVLIEIAANQKELTLPEKRELRSAPLGLRITPTLKAALERAANDENRSVASMAEVILTEWLQGRGYLNDVQQS